MQKKPYTTPKLTDHGSVVEKTKGRVGWSYEPMGQMVWDDDLEGLGKPVKESK